MASLFLSHSSDDNEAAEQMGRRLKEHGYDSLFLDFDPDSGIKAGRDWERELYRNLKLAGAVIVLCSPGAMASRWCFVEIAQAKALGKAIFPFVIVPCQVDKILTDRQVIDLTALGEDEAYRRLFDGLRAGGLDPADSFDWDPRKRPPFPGFNYFEFDDAGIYFGREREGRELLDKLTQIQRQGEQRLLVLVGSSGSGKSSLVRAGVLPRLAKDWSRWVLVEPFRPGTEPICELAKALSLAFPDGPARSDWKAIRDRLRREARVANTGDDAQANSVICEYGEDLTMALGLREASVLVVVDQAEELLQGAAPVESAKFLTVLRAATSRPGGRIFALLTLRSDFLGTFQNQPALRGGAFANITLGPLPVERFARVIEGPAARAGIEIEHGLVNEMIAEAQTDDALPLLAFTLREMYERCKDRTEFTLKVYHVELGGIIGSVKTAVEQIRPQGGWPDETIVALRRAFLKLTRVNDEGRFTRQPARWADLPDLATPVLQRFVEARLLTSNGDTVEVTHESLFRVWPDLAGWLDEGRELMLWKRNVKDEVNGWMNHDRSPRYLLSGGRAGEAERWLASHSGEFHGPEAEFLKASVANERRKQLRLKIFAGVVSGLLAIAVGMGFYANSARKVADKATVEAKEQAKKAIEKEGIANEATEKAKTSETKARENEAEARKQARVATSRQLAALSVSERSNRLDRSLLLSSEALRIEDTFEARDSLFKALQDRPELRTFLHIEEGDVGGVAFSPDRKYIAAGYGSVGGGGVVLWDVVTRKRLADDPLIVKEGNVTGVSFSPDGKTLAAGYGRDDGSVSGVVLWEVASRRRLSDDPLTVKEGNVTGVSFSPDGKTLAVGYGGGGGVVLWDVAARKRLSGDPLTVFAANVNTVSFSPDGKTLAAGYFGFDTSRGVALWDVAARRRLADDPLTEIAGYINGVSFSPDGKTLAASYGGFGGGGGVVLWDVAGRKRLANDPLTVNEGRLNGVSFSPDGKTLAAGYYFGGVGGVVLLDLVGRNRLTDNPLTVNKSNLNGVSFSPDGKTLAAGYHHGDNGGVVLWDVAARRCLAENPLTEIAGYVKSVSYSPDGKTLVAGYGVGSGVGGVMFWDVASRKRMSDDPLIVKGGPFESVSFSPDGKTLAAGYGVGDSGGGVVLWDVASRKRKSDDFLIVKEGAVKTVSFSPDGKTVAAGYGIGAGFGGVVLWDVAARKRLTANPLSVKEGHVNGVSFTPDGKTLAVGYGGVGSGGVLLWDVASRKRLSDDPLIVKEGGVSGVSFSPDGKTLAAGCGDLIGRVGGVVLWDVARRKRLAGRPLTVKEGPVESVSFSLDGKTLAAGYDGYTLVDGVVVLDLDLKSWQRIAGRVANRNFTRDERRQYFPDQPYRRTFRNLPWPSALPKEEQTEAELWERDHPAKQEELVKD